MNNTHEQTYILLINRYKFYVSTQKVSALSIQKIYFCNRLQKRKFFIYIYEKQHKRHMNNNEVTIYDIAKKLGISASTVSRALAGNKLIKKATVDRVRQCAEELGYRSNPFASNLRRGATNTIGVVVHRLDSPFVSSFLMGAEQTANAKGYNLMILQSFEDVEKEKANLKTLLDKRVDGIIAAITRNTNNVDHFKNVQSFNIPLVLFDRVSEKIDCQKVVINNYAAAAEVAQHLISQGCHNIVNATINTPISTYTERTKGFSDTLKKSKIQLRTIYMDNLDFESGQKLATELKQNMPDGVFCPNDISACGLIVGLQQIGIKVPEDVAVIGFNNSNVSQVITPNLTTIEYPAYELGVTAANSLLEAISLKGSNIINRTITLQHKLIIRKSSIHNK